MQRQLKLGDIYKNMLGVEHMICEVQDWVGPLGEDMVVIYGRHVSKAGPRNAYLGTVHKKSIDSDLKNSFITFVRRGTRAEIAWVLPQKPKKLVDLFK